MIREPLWNSVTLLQDDGQFRLSTDSVLLAAFARFPAGAQVADLGCGGGAVSMLLLANDPTLHLTGIELQAGAAAVARENAACNNADLTVIHGDLRNIRQLLPAGSMDCAISNPPYFPVGSGMTARDPYLALARSEQTCTLPQLAEAAQWLLRSGGRFALVHRAERLADVICALREHQLEPKRLRFVRHSPGAPVSLLLMEARKGGRPGLIYEQDLVLRDENGQETEETRTIYHR